MDPMIDLPLLARRHLFRFLCKGSKKNCRLVNNLWAERIDTEGRLSIIVKPDIKENLEFINSIWEPYSLCFEDTEKIKESPEKYTKDYHHSYTGIRVLRIKLPVEFEFLKEELFPRKYIKELDLCGDFLWRSSFDCSIKKETQDFSEEKIRCFLPYLKILKLQAQEPEKLADVNDLYFFDSQCREVAQQNIFFILKLIQAPNLKTFICKTISCEMDFFLGNIKTYVEFITECSQSLRTLEMGCQPCHIIENYGNSFSMPKLEEFKVTFYNLGRSTEITIFDIDGYWGTLLKSQRCLKKLLLEYSTTTPTEFFYVIINQNQNTLEEISFACNYHNTHLVWVPEGNITFFDCSVFSKCHRLRKLSMSSDWELYNLQGLPRSIEHLGFEGCLITTENFLKLDLPLLRSIAVTRNIFANTRQNELEINEEVVKFLTHMRSLNILFIEKRRNTVDTGVDELEEFLKAYAPIADQIPEERCYPEHYVALLIFQKTQ